MSEPVEVPSDEVDRDSGLRVRRVEQDGREVLLTELGAARERVNWLVAQNDRFRQDAAEATVQAEEFAKQAGEAKSSAINWRLLGILALGAHVAQWLVRFLPAS